MSDIISRQAAIDAIRNMCEECDSDYCGECRVGRNDCEKVLEGLPSAQPQTGHWISERREWEYTLRCSECGYTYIPRGLEDGTLDQADIHHYCPLCGTKMDRG
jgi:DNA-directed RNA polymerase subunit RPC12/RpoP